ncbi:MAG: hypothetical protein ACI4SJ_05810, partial [Candidatus Avispirillum sp.]
AKPPALQNAAGLFGGKAQMGFETVHMRLTLALLSNLTSPSFIPSYTVYARKSQPPIRTVFSQKP